MNIPPETRAVTLLCMLARRFDMAGLSGGRTRESELLDAALALLPKVDQTDLPQAINAVDEDRILLETKEYLWNKHLR